jgi:hypothetical protein
VVVLKERAFSHYPRIVKEPKYKNEKTVVGIDQQILWRDARNNVESVNLF